MLPLSFFTDNIGKTLKRSRKDIHTKEEHTSYVHIKDDREAEYHYDMQSEHITYEVNTPTIHRPRIHAGDSVCLACEG